MPTTLGPIDPICLAWGLPNVNWVLRTPGFGLAVCSVEGRICHVLGKHPTLMERPCQSADAWSATDLFHSSAGALRPQSNRREASRTREAQSRVRHCKLVWRQIAGPRDGVRRTIQRTSAHRRASHVAARHQGQGHKPPKRTLGGCEDQRPRSLGGRPADRPFKGRGGAAWLYSSWPRASGSEGLDRAQKIARFFPAGAAQQEAFYKRAGHCASSRIIAKTANHACSSPQITPSMTVIQLRTGIADLRFSGNPAAVSKNRVDTESPHQMPCRQALRS